MLGLGGKNSWHWGKKIKERNFYSIFRVCINSMASNHTLLQQISMLIVKKNCQFYNASATKYRKEKKRVYVKFAKV